MTSPTSQIPLKLLAPCLAFLLSFAVAPAQQATTPPAGANVAKKHPAAVKYNSITMKSADSNDPKSQQPQADSSQPERRKNGAVIAADFNKKQATAPDKGASTAFQAQESQSPSSPAAKGIGSAGIPGKAAPAGIKTRNTDLKGVGNGHNAQQK